MIDKATRAKYRPTIGIETHVQLKTKTKLFSGAGNDARQAAPNTLVNHIDFGLPGALPVLNEAAIELAVKAAFALNSSPQAFSKFDRKHYFYPDLPMGYQITQYDQPIILGGAISITVEGQTKDIGITRAHLEADAGKSTHLAGKDYSLVDLNRAGTPLLEIVSQPDMSSSAEAKAYARELYLAMRYAGVSDADLYYGNMRFDVNVSVSNTNELGVRTETKNLNSFRSVEKTVEFEISRQIELLEKSQPVAQETRGWDEAKQKTFVQRTKENADDYRYMPDPDIPPVVLSDDFIAKLKVDMPLMPSAWRIKLTALGLDQSQVETLLEAEVENEAVNYLSLLVKLLDQPELAKFMANYMVNLEVPLRRDNKPANQLSEAGRSRLYEGSFNLYKAAKISSTNVKSLISELLAKAELPESIEDYASQAGYRQLSDESAIAAIVSQVIKANPQAAEDVKNGELRAIGFLVGQVMKQSQGQANPELATQLIKQQLGV